MIVSSMITVYRIKPEYSLKMIISSFFIMCLYHTLCLPVYWLPFSSTVFSNNKDDMDIFNHHWIIKTIQHIIMTGIIIYNIIVYNQTDDHTIAFGIFIISQVCLFVKYITLYLIFKWNEINYYGEYASSDITIITGKNKQLVDNFKSIQCCC